MNEIFWYRPQIEGGLFNVREDTDFTIGLTEPYFMDRDLSGSFDIFRRKNKSGDTTVNETGLSFGVGFAAARDVYHRLRYDLSKSKTSVGSTTATSQTGEEGKSLYGSSVAYTLSKDSRDSRFDPTEGYFLELDETVSGLGGDVKFLRTKFSAAYYKPLLFKSVVLGLAGEVGHISGLGDKVTQSKRFNLGGQKVRGFDGAGIGPRDVGSGDSVGGNTMYSGRIEVLSNLGLNKDTGVRWTVFSDFGSLWGTDYPTNVTEADANDIRASLGIGFIGQQQLGHYHFLGKSDKQNGS